MNSSLVAPRERSLFVVCLLVSLAGYAGALTLGWLGVSILAGGALIALVLNGWMLGHIRGNAVRVSDRQFPDVYRLAE